MATSDDDIEAQHQVDLLYLSVMQHVMHDAVGRQATPRLLADINETARSYGMGVVFDGIMIRLVDSTLDVEQQMDDLDTGALIRGVVERLGYWQHDVRANLNATLQAGHRSRIDMSVLRVTELLSAAPPDVMPGLLEHVLGMLVSELPFDLTEAAAVQLMQLAAKKRDANHG